MAGEFGDLSYWKHSVKKKRDAHSKWAHPLALGPLAFGSSEHRVQGRCLHLGTIPRHAQLSETSPQAPEEPKCGRAKTKTGRIIKSLRPRPIRLDNK